MAVLVRIDAGPGRPGGPDPTLELVGAVAAALSRRGCAALARDDAAAAELPARTFPSRAEEAAFFLAVRGDGPHAGGDGCEVWVHDRAGPASVRAAEAIASAFGAALGRAAPVRRGPVALLAPHWHAPGAAACLVRLAGEALDDRSELRARLADRLADAVAPDAAAGRHPEPPAPAAPSAPGATSGSAAVPAPGREVHQVSERFDVWHEVPLVPQLTGMSCWAAAAAMLVGWRDCVDVDPEEVAHGAGRWEAYRDGLEPEDVAVLAQAWDLVAEPPRDYGVAELRRLLEENGPLWVGEASPGLHVVVVAGMYGDGTPEGTSVRIADPWPEGRGERYAVVFRTWRRNLDAAAHLAGGGIQVLHCGGRARGRRRIVREWSEVAVRSS